MQGAHDSSNHGGFARHAASKLAHQQATDVKISAHGDLNTTHITANLELITLITALIAIIYLKPQILCAREFYKNCFKNMCWWHPPRRWVFDVLWFIADAFMVVAMAHYLYTARNPAAGADTSYYIAIYSIFIVYLGARYFWINSFWNYHSSKNLVNENGDKEVMNYTSEPAVALGFAVFWAFIMWLAVTILVVLFIIRHDYWAMGFALAVWIWLIFILVWTAMVRSCISCLKTCAPKKSVCAPKRCPTGNGLGF